MLNFQAARLMHRHDDEWVEMSQVGDRSADSLDPERRLAHRVRLFRCKSCDEEIQVEEADSFG